VETAVDLDQIEHGEYIIAPGYDPSLQKIKDERDRCEEQIKEVYAETSKYLGLKGPDAEKVLKMDKNPQVGDLLRGLLKNLIFLILICCFPGVLYGLASTGAGGGGVSGCIRALRLKVPEVEMVKKLLVGAASSPFALRSLLWARRSRINCDGSSIGPCECVPSIRGWRARGRAGSSMVTHLRGERFLVETVLCLSYFAVRDLVGSCGLLTDWQVA
jgi:hypothetical protein